MFQIIAIATCLATVGAVQPYDGRGGGHHEQDYYTEPHYSFVYEVKDLHTQDIKSHKEERKGEHTQGVYELVEPDGSNRKVEYTVEGKSGFNAVVHREHIKHPVSRYKGGYPSGESGGFGSSGGGYNSGGGFGSASAYAGNKGGANSYSSLSTKGSLGGHYNVQSEREYGGQSGFGSGNSRDYSSGAGYGGHSSAALLSSYEGEGDGSLGGHNIYSSRTHLGDYAGLEGPSYGGHSSSAYDGSSQNDATSYASFSLHGNLGGQATGYSTGLQGGYGGHSSGGYGNGQQVDYSSGGATSYVGYLSRNGGLGGQSGGSYQVKPVQIAYHYGQSAESMDGEGYSSGYSGGPSSGGYGGHSTVSSGGYASAAGEYDGEHATSSVKFSTHGAKVTTSTQHIIPAKHHSPHY